MDLRVVSIGTLSLHPLWGEKEPLRTGHSTTTLIREGSRAILVDPGLPPQVVAARLFERAGITPEDITHVFLTRFSPEHTRGLDAFQHATWWIHPTERETVGVALATELARAHQAGEADLKAALERDVARLHACTEPPDALCEGVTLFPLPGVSPGLCGLVVAQPLATAVICGDAIATVEHLEQGKVLPNPTDVDQARASFADAVELADWLILGRDNIVPNHARRSPF